MERIDSDQPKILESICLGKFLIYRSKAEKAMCPETFKAEKIVN